MFIFNKEKHFNKITADFFDRSVADISELDIILFNHGAGKYIEKDSDRFFLFSFLFLLFFQDVALQQKYANKYKSDIAIVLNKLIYGFSQRLSYDPKDVSKLYLTIREQLNDLSTRSKSFGLDLYHGVACCYLVGTFRDSYNPENTDVYFELATFFQRIMNKNIEYLA